MELTQVYSQVISPPEQNLGASGSGIFTFQTDSSFGIWIVGLRATVLDTSFASQGLSDITITVSDTRTDKTFLRATNPVPASNLFSQITDGFKSDLAAPYLLGENSVLSINANNRAASARLVSFAVIGVRYDITAGPEGKMAAYEMAKQSLK
jgi:hypothetical protein